MVARGGEEAFVYLVRDGRRVGTMRRRGGWRLQQRGNGELDKREGMILSVKSKWEKRKREEFEGREEKTVLMIQVAAITTLARRHNWRHGAPARRNRKRREPGLRAFPGFWIKCEST